MRAIALERVWTWSLCGTGHSGNGRSVIRPVEDQARADLIIISDDFTGRRLARKWVSERGRTAVSEAGLVLTSTGDAGGGASVHSRALVLPGVALRARVRSNGWCPDTSIGFETWDDWDHYAVVVTRGKLRIVSPPQTDDIAIPEWSAVARDTIDLELFWQADGVQLQVAGSVSIPFYPTRLSPRRPLHLRLCASNDVEDELEVRSVEVRTLT